MRRMLCLTTLTVVGVLLAVVANEARQERFRIRTLELAENLYVLTSDPAEQGMRTGGNTAVLVTASGVALVDTKIRGYGEDILAAVRRITDKPVTTIINTHTHWDHSGANTEFPDTVDVVVHENTAAHMASSDCDDGAGFEGGSIKNCEAFSGDNSRYLPKITFGNRTSLFSGPDQIDLYYFGRGHTDGDTWVVFREARAMHTGDMMARKGLRSSTRQHQRQRDRVRFDAAERRRRHPERRHHHPRARRRPAGVGRPRRLRRVLQGPADPRAGGSRGRAERGRDRGGLLGAGRVQRLSGAGGPAPGHRAAHLRWALTAMAAAVRATDARRNGMVSYSVP